MGSVFRQCLLLVTLLLGVAFPVFGEDDLPSQEIVIAVRAHSGDEAALKKWGPTADYLSTRLAGYRFVILPLVGFDEMRQAVVEKKAHFVLTNPTAYVDLELHSGISRIVTLINKGVDIPVSEFAGVIFSRADRDDINVLTDIPGKTIMGVEKEAFGGWLMARREIEAAGINPFKQCKEVLFAGTQEPIVYAVRDSKVDIGTVRTEIIDSMARKGLIDRADFKIINRWDDDFPYPHSTRLYPEWPFARARHTSPSLSAKVAIALLQMEEDDQAALLGKYQGWTVPLDYGAVHDLLRELRVGPYKGYGAVTLASIYKKYRFWILALAITICCGILLLVRNTLLNKRLFHSNRELTELKENLEAMVQERTSSLAQEAAEHRKALQVLEKTNALLDEVQALTRVGGWEYNVAAGHLTWTGEVFRIHEIDDDYAPDDVKKSFGYYRGEARDSIAAAFAAAVRDGTPYDLELPLVTARGKERWVRTIGRAERKDGETSRVFGMIMDITEPRQREEELRLLNEELRAINRIMSTTTTAAEVNEILPELLDEAIELSGLDGGTICLIGPDDRLHFAAYRTQGKPVDHPVPDMPLSDCPCEACRQSHKPLILHNQPQETASGCAVSGEKEVFPRAAFPLIIGARCIGILCLSSRTENTLSERKFTLLESVAAQIAIAVDNARMFEAISTHAATLEDRVRERTEDLEKSRQAMQLLLEDMEESQQKLARLNKQFVGRELRMRELKAEIASLRKKTAIAKDEEKN